MDTPIADTLRRATLVALLSMGPSVASGGAWLQAPGDLYLKTSILHLDSDARASADGARVPVEAFGGSYREMQFFTYAEFGAWSRVTLLGSVAYKDARIVDGDVPDYGTRSTGDLRVGARLGLLEGAVPVSSETVVSIPTYPTSDPRAPIGAREQFLPAGTGRLEIESRVQAGLSLHPLPFYVNAEAGVRARGGDYGDQWLLLFEVGASTDRVFVKSDVRGIIGHGELDGSVAAGAVTIDERVWFWAPEVSVRVGRDVWLGTGVSVPFAARNSLVGPQWSISLAWQRKSR